MEKLNYVANRKFYYSVHLVDQCAILSYDWIKRNSPPILRHPFFASKYKTV